MAAHTPTYDLVLLLDTSAEGAQRKKVLSDVDKILSSNKATTVGTHDWGKRQTAYEIDKKTEAEYHLIQFQGPPTVPAELNRVLKITDAVLRHRVVKLDAGTPPPPDLKSAASARTDTTPPVAEAAPEPEAPAVEAPKAEVPAAEAPADKTAAEAPESEVSAAEPTAAADES